MVAGDRFLNLAQVGDELGTSRSQVYALVRSGVLRGIKVGGRGQWRVGREDLEAFVAGAYADTRAFVAEHPFGPQVAPPVMEASTQVGLMGGQVW